jgi:cytochrome c oxidase subunit II
LSRRKILLAAAFGLLAITLLAAPAAQAIEIAPPEPHSPNAETIRSTYWVTLVVVVAVIVVVNAALIAAVVRFREQRGREPARITAARGALRAPIAGLSVLALALFVYGVIQTDDARSIEPAGPNGLGADQTAQVGIKGAPPASLLEAEEGTDDEDPTQTSPLQVEAFAQQWLWRFEYPGHEPSAPLFSYGELVVPVDTPVILNVTSTDVLHSWWVPALGGQVQASPNEVVQTWFKADEVGRYAGNSTIFSGSAYPAMRSWVRVVTVPEYQDYVETLETELRDAQDIIFGEQQRSEVGE